MNYFTVLYVTYNDGTANKKAMYDAESKDLALRDMHKYCSNFMCADNVDAVEALACTSQSGQFDKATWVRPVTYSTEEPTEAEA